jgi:hypothetical protein
MNAANQDVMRRYLLGAADAETMREIEERLFSDDRVFWERVAIAEDELIDEYAGGTLDGEEQALFDANFLVTAERRAKLEFARALGRYARQQERRPHSLSGWLRVPAAVPRWAMAAAAVLVLLVPAALRQFAPAGSRPAPVAVSLVPGLLRDAGGEIARVLPAPGCQIVHVDLTAGPDPYPAYAATVHDENGDAVWSQHKLAGVARAGAVSVRLTLPCELLPEGDYWVRLSGLSSGQEPVPLDRYDFRVLRQ